MKAVDRSLKATQSGVDGALFGYGGGLPRKRALLDLEAGKRILGPPMLTAKIKK